jgi:hypothetical protein
MKAKWSRFFGMVLLLFSIGCANLDYRPPIKTSYIPNAGKGYIYGKFSLRKDFMNNARLALQVENKTSGNLISIRLLDENQVYAIEVDPGTYQLKNFVYALLGAVMEFETRKIAIPANPAYLSQQFIVERGKAYYIGDYFGSSQRTGVLVTPYVVGASFQGGIIGIEQQFEKTSSELNTFLPSFRSIDKKSAWPQ